MRIIGVVLAIVCAVAGLLLVASGSVLIGLAVLAIGAGLWIEARRRSQR